MTTPPSSLGGAPDPVASPTLAVGLVTDDESLVHRIGVALASAGARLDVASDPPAALDVISSSRYGARVVDVLALRRLLPDLAKMQGASGAAGVELWLGAPATCFAAGRAFTTHAYANGAVDALVTHLTSLLPDTAGERGLRGMILGETPAIQFVREQVKHVARYREVSVLLLGETGTGKELVAEAIHRTTCTPSQPFIAINCAAIPESLFESELFGHEAGAYTGARGVRIGLLEAAAGGTIFLDEIGEMPISLQPKLLRVLETRAFRRVGSNRDVPLTARVVSATNRLLFRREDARVRPDLYFRLAGFSIVLPPLRERVADIDELATAFVRIFRERHRIPDLRLSTSAIARLRAHPWLGNVRELRSVVEHAAILADGAIGDREVERVLVHHPQQHLGHPSHPPPRATVPPPPALPVAPAPPSLAPATPPTAAEIGSRTAASAATARRPVREVERDLILRGYDECGGNLSRASALLGIPRTTLRARLRRYGVL